MIWKILTFVFGWLLCGAWSIRIEEKKQDYVEDEIWMFYSTGPIGLIIVWLFIWPERIWNFGKGVIEAWKLK